jgi:hypothetical protein
MHSTGDNQPKKGAGYFASRLKEKGAGTEERNPQRLVLHHKKTQRGYAQI